MATFLDTFLSFTRLHLLQRHQVPAFLAFFEDFPERWLIYIGELEAAIALFQRYQAGFQPQPSVPLINADYSIKYLEGKKLPTFIEIERQALQTQDWQLIETSIQHMMEFNFIDTMQPVTMCAPAFIIAWYRTYLRTLYPKLVAQNVQFASALEEMLAILALNGTKTHIFEATKPWLLDADGEGFDPTFSQAVATIR